MIGWHAHHTEEGSQKGENKYILTHIYGLQKNGTDEPTCWAGTEMQTQRMHLWTQVGEKRAGYIERAALAYKHYCTQNV